MELGLVRTLEEIVIEDTDTENEPGRYMSQIIIILKYFFD
jgi:hypothetical protein